MSGRTASTALSEDGRRVDDFLAELDLPLRDAGDVQQVVDQAGEVA